MAQSFDEEFDGKFDEVFDVVVVGSGGAGFATALGAADSGLSTLMVEGSEKWGGSTSMSGGGMWLPNNPLMQRDRVGDSREEAIEYMMASIGTPSKSASPERQAAFVDGVADFVNTAEKHGVEFVRAPNYPDYYPELPGGKIGRGIEVKPLDSKRIGSWWDTMLGAVPLPAKTDDVWLLGRAWSTPSGFMRGAQLVFRGAGGVVTGKRLTGIGSAWATAFLEAVVLKLGVPLWLDSPIEELIMDDGRVIGAVINRAGKKVRVGARRGVMLAAGGFESNVEWRKKYHGIEGSPSGNEYNTGATITLAQKAGAAVELMDDAWWGGSIEAFPGGSPSFIVGERSMPYSLMVDSEGKRFANESESYVDLGHHMQQVDGGKGPYWLIMDSRYVVRYFRTFAMDPRANKARKEAGLEVKAKTLDELAGKMNVNPAVLSGTVERFNGFARAGVDGDFGRGNSAYDRYYGDPTVHPNPNLGAVERAPYHAYRVVLGDLGTKGGVLTDEDGRALRSDGSVIEGLYAAGNNSASVMGNTYPGPGSTIAPAAVFGMRAAREMARK